MAFSYPLSLPQTEDAAFMRFEWAREPSVAVHGSPFTRVMQTQEHAGEQWQAVVSLRAMKEGDAEPWRAFFAELRGPHGTFLLGDPRRLTPRGTPTGTPLVNGASQTGFTLVTDGWDNGSTGNLLPGDLISIGSGETTRLYRVLASVDADGSGNATISIWPRLRESPANDAAITTTNPRGTFRLTPQAEREITLPGGLYTGWGFEAVEAR